MKRLQIMIEEDLDQALAVRALQEKTSKAALIRQFVRERLVPPVPPLEDDPIWQWATEGFEGEPGIGDSESVDDVVYPR